MIESSDDAHPLKQAAGDTRFDATAAAQMETLECDLGQMYRERNEALREVVAAHQDTLYKLALAAEYKDDDTGVHIVRIVDALLQDWASFVALHDCVTESRITFGDLIQAPGHEWSLT